MTSGRKYGTAALETNCTLLGDYKQKTSLSRHDTVLLNRLRIGYTRLTHSYLLSGDDLPECGTCQCALTVKHILVECVDLKDVRYEINTLLLLPLKIYLIVLKHIKSLCTVSYSSSGRLIGISRRCLIVIKLE